MWAQTDVGLKRGINQDTILVDHDLMLYIVADGMGGHKGGEVASALAVNIVQNRLKEALGYGKVAPKQVLIKAYKEASERIHFKSTFENPELMGMGTTMVGAFRFGSKLFIANVGDSRAYLMRDKFIWQLTEDHSLINEQLRAGMINEEEAKLGARNVITRSVGFEKDVAVDVIERKVEGGDTYLLCSDGLSGLVPDYRLLEICRQGPVKESVAQCIKEAKAAGGDDNISVIIIRVVEA